MMVNRAAFAGLGLDCEGAGIAAFHAVLMRLTFRNRTSLFSWRFSASNILPFAGRLSRGIVEESNGVRVEMSPPVTPQCLLEGAVYALEQCGLLLRDANILFRNGSYANAVVLAAFAREELGRFIILLNSRKQALAGKTSTIKEIQDHCDDHVAKQQAGMLSIVMTADRDSGLGKVLRVRSEAYPQSPEWKEADDQLAKLDRKKKGRVPRERHEKRMSSLYVEPVSQSEWNRPANTSPSSARVFLQDAVNDYAGRYGNGYSTSSLPILKDIDPELYDALEQWSDRPELPCPEWPPAA
jgi:AbiV family abortive infection protein